jgi:phosphatidylinositol alpha-mannosyltransferase
MHWGYESQVQGLGVPDVEFLGHVPAAVLPHYYTAADVFCAPATGGESFGIVLLEAMASGVPVVASDIPGFAQVVSPEVDGLLVKPRQPQAWASALNTLLDNPQMRASMGAAGVRKAQLYDWERVVDSVLHVYREARARAGAHQVAAGVHSQVPGLG